MASISESIKGQASAQGIDVGEGTGGGAGLGLQGFGVTQFENITGETAADAATDAATIQADAALAAAQLQAQSEQDQIASQEAADAQQRLDLQPAVAFGSQFQPGFENAMAQQSQLFGAGAGDQIMNNPMFQAIQAQNQRDILANQSLGGRLNTGETPQFLQDSALRTGFDILNQERSAAIQNTQSFLNPIQMGFNAAAGQGTSAFNTGANIANTMQNSVLGQNQFNTDASAANAAGVVGAANAEAAGTQNLISLGTQSFGVPTFG